MNGNRTRVRRGPKVHKLRRKLARRDGDLCFYCRRHFADLRTATFDHYIPYRLWRTHWQANLVLACQPCNHRKGGALPWPIAWLLLANADRLLASQTAMASTEGHHVPLSALAA